MRSPCSRTTTSRARRGDADRRAPSDVPVPRGPVVRARPAVLGAPFFVMERVDGVRARRAAVRVRQLAHRGDGRGAAACGAPAWSTCSPASTASTPTRTSCDSSSSRSPGDTPLRRHVANQRRYYDWIAQRGGDLLPGHRAPASRGSRRTGRRTKSAVAQLGRRPPATSCSATSAGRGARLGGGGGRARELDLGWFLFFHRYFQGRRALRVMPGLPTFLEPQPRRRRRTRRGPGTSVETSTGTSSTPSCARR